MQKIILIIGVTSLFLALPSRLLAADPENSQIGPRKPSPSSPNKNAIQFVPTLEQRMSPEQRQRFNQDMETQTGKAYPDFAQIESRRQKMRERLPERMRQADTDNDNSISRAEAEESMPGVARHFDQIDANHDSVITYDEMKTAQEKKHKAAELQAKQDNERKAQPKKKKKNTRKKNNTPPKESGQEQSSITAPASEEVPQHD
jgi:hypothetical protein